MTMELWVTGGGFVTSQGYGRLSAGQAVSLAPGEPAVPRGAEVFDTPPTRYGRFDAYTKMGCAAAALALGDAGLERAEAKRGIGMVTSSRTECLETDLAYYGTTLDAGGTLASPNLFSYTLPGIVQGECAVLFKMTGPTFCVGDDGGGGHSALTAAVALIRAGKAPAMLAGWIESPPADVAGDAIRGALFVTIETAGRGGARAWHRLSAAAGGVCFPDGRRVQSLLDFFQKNSEGGECHRGSAGAR